jgi:DNA-binding transcriptional ArsR family regulator/predicted DNA-binding protein (MmcQ/YjbR family)
MSDAQHKQRELDSVLSALAHETRRHVTLVIWFAGGLMSAGEIAARFSHSWPTTSRHLRVLEQAGLLRFKRHGRNRVYWLNQEKLTIVQDWLRWFQQKPAEVGDPVAESRIAAPPETVLRNIALAYPDAHEDADGTETVIRVGRRPFTIFRALDQGFIMKAKLPLSKKAALDEPFAQPVQYRLGTSEWVTARFGADDDVPIELLWEWIDESYRATAPRKRLKELPPPPTSQRGAN